MQTIAVLYINISGEGIKEKDIDVLLNAIQSNNNITTLYFIADHMTHKHIESIKNLLISNCMKKFWLEGNLITDNDILSLSAIIADNDHLTVLSISGKQLGFAALAAIAKNLKQNTTLINLSLKLDLLFFEDAKKIVFQLTFTVRSA